MPPASSQKGTGKKGAGAIARQRSRNTTPSSVPLVTASASLPPIEHKTTEYLDLDYDTFRNITYDDVVDQTASGSHMPESKSLTGIITRFDQLQETLEKRSTFCDRGMRLLVNALKNRMDEDAAERNRQEERQRALDEERARKANKANKKKRKAADSLAPGDGNTERSSPLRDSKKERKLSRDSASSSLSPVAPATPGAMDVDEKAKAKKKTEDADESDSSSGSDDGAPPPPQLPRAMTFGEDPSTFPDPTVYQITEVDWKSMTDEQIKEATSVATYPHTDLADLIAGVPPDKDFSSAKPTNQIAFNTFSTHVEPYFRPFTEEDLAFLRERGNRVDPFLLPKRSKKHYTEVWAEEDGAMAIDSLPDKPDPNHPRGSIEHMTDDIAETDKLSVGPLLSRLLQAMRPERRTVANDDARPLANGLNGNAAGDLDVNMSGVDSFDVAAPPVSQPNGLPSERELSPAAHMPESNSEAWKRATHPKLDYNQYEERIKQELRHIGFLPDPDSDQPQSEETRADYDGAYDDEVAARLRELQSHLRDQMLINAARKAKLSELVRERMAFQEYTTILEDLDTQVQAAYLKRTRTMGKTKKKARPNAAGAAAAAAGIARPGIGDMTKTLMERRRRWIDNIGTVFDGESLGKVPRSKDPNSTIFKPEEMMELIKNERAHWDDEEDE